MTRMLTSLCALLLLAALLGCDSGSFGSGSSERDEETATTAPPELPANQRYQYQDTGSAIVLSWDASPSADHYTVYHDDFFDSSCRVRPSGPGPAFCDELATDLTATSYTHTSLERLVNYYWVVACNSFGCSKIDTENPARLGGVPPHSPGNQSYSFEASAAGLETVVAWDATARADYYNIYYSRFSISSVLPDSYKLATGVTGAGYTHTSPDGSDNYYWVVACNEFGCSPTNIRNPARLSGPAPVCDIWELVAGAPQEPTLTTSRDGTAVRLRWTPAQGPEPAHYNVYRSVSINPNPSSSECKFALAENLTGTTYAYENEQVLPVPDAPQVVRVTGRTSDSLTIHWESPRLRFSYAVSACNAAGCSRLVEEAHAYGPQEIGHFALHRSTSENSTGGDGVTMEIPAMAGDLARVSGFLVDSTYRDVGLQPSTAYFYELRSCTESGCSPPGQAAGLTEAIGPVDIPPAPTIREEKVVVSLGTDRARVIWETVDGATYFQVYQSDHTGRGEELDAEVSAPETSYYDLHPESFGFEFEATGYRVKACNKAGCSAFSKRVVVR